MLTSCPLGVTRNFTTGERSKGKALCEGSDPVIRDTGRSDRQAVLEGGNAASGARGSLATCSGDIGGHSECSMGGRKGRGESGLQVHTATWWI